MAIAAAIQVEAGRRSGEDLRITLGILQKRSDIVSVLSVLQLVVEVGGAVLLVLGERPACAVAPIANPLDGVARVVATHERTVVVHHVELIARNGLVPDAGIQDDLLTMGDSLGIRDAHLLRGVQSEVFVLQGGVLDQVHPLGGNVARNAIEAIGVASRQIERVCANVEAIPAGIGTRSRDHLDNGALGSRVITQRNVLSLDGEVLLSSIHHRGHTVRVATNAFKRPLGNILALCHEQHAGAVNRVLAHEHIDGAEALLFVHGHAVGAQRGGLGRIVVIRDAVGRSIKAVRIVIHLV